jgi:hypothetical protein
MKNSEELFGRVVLGGVILLSNILLFSLWAWRTELSSGADTSDPAFNLNRSGNLSLIPEGILRNPESLRWVFKEVNEERQILFLGTSESTVRHDLSSQLNAIRPETPRIVRLAKAGLSPIHQCIALASAEKHGLSFPPMVLVVNPVYFTESHDVINEGWLATTARTSAFYLVDHDGIHHHLTQDVLNAYGKYFAFRLPLYPLWMQQYLGNLMFLNFSCRTVAVRLPDNLPVRLYRFEGTKQPYDDDRNVPVGYVAADQSAKWRWDVSVAEESLNLKGIRCSIDILGRQGSPVLLLFLPINRQFYAYNGLDMAEYDRRFGQIRAEIKLATRADGIEFIDLYETPLDGGFEDRMHLDAYGNYQIALAIERSEGYQRFLTAIGNYYRHVSFPDSGQRD